MQEGRVFRTLTIIHAFTNQVQLIRGKGTFNSTWSMS